MRIVATFTAAFADRTRNSEVIASGDGLTYAVHVGDETSNVMAKVAETPSLTVALATARRWMDSIEADEDGTDSDRFAEGARQAHDADPDAWHRGMLKPPAPRSTRCAFCGVPWADEDGTPKHSSDGLMGYESMRCANDLDGCDDKACICRCHDEAGGP